MVLRTFALAIFALVVSLTVPAAQAAGAEEVLSIPVRDGTRVHVVINRGEPNQETFVFLNGLIWESARWQTVSEMLNAKGHTIIRMPFRLQPESLRLLRRGEEPKVFAQGTTAAHMAEDLRDVLAALKIRSRIQLVGLSYGGTVASEFSVQFPKAVANTVLISPLVVPLDHYDPSGQYLRTWLSTVRFWENATCDMYSMWNPFLCAHRDYWYNTFYDAIYERFLIDRVQNVPRDLNPAIYKKSVFHLVRAVRDFDLNVYTPKIARLHLMLASRDERALFEDQARVWAQTPKANKKSLVVFVGAQHGLPVESPVRTSEWLEAIAVNAPELQQGRSFKVRADR
ncbi:MAG: alpha/beta hydrolase [Bdellovibrionaceae bacterium]|nr:alpha/beta hydrolase [Pseudobdellovibrionaceae bacterium]